MACLIPNVILIPGYNHTLAFITERMSLAAGVSMCAVLGGSRPRATFRYGYIAIAALFFAFLFRDERALNRFENRIDSLTAQLPYGVRVVSPINDPSLRVNSLVHMIDRACVGRCFSVANYEPSTAQFRLRATPGNPYVAATYRDSWELQNGQHIRRDTEPPLICVALDSGNRLAAHEWKSDSQCQPILWNVLQDLPGKP